MKIWFQTKFGSRSGTKLKYVRTKFSKGWNQKKGGGLNQIWSGTKFSRGQNQIFQRLQPKKSSWNQIFTWNQMQNQMQNQISEPNLKIAFFIVFCGASRTSKNLVRWLVLHLVPPVGSPDGSPFGSANWFPQSVPLGGQTCKSTGWSTPSRLHVGPLSRPRLQA